jgi:hypothetical protein
MWCIQQITQEYRERMYILLELYEQEYDELHPVICVDEKSKQFLEEIRNPIAMKPGSPYKYDYEYKRKGTGNLFVAVEPKAGKRIVKITDTRTKPDYAHFIKELLEKYYPQAKSIRLVADNLNTHFTSSFYETFSKPQADKLLRRIEFYYTPKHASWLNMAEIEINIMDRQCTGRRIASKAEMEKEVSAWVLERNKRKKNFNGLLPNNMQIKSYANIMLHN